MVLMFYIYKISIYFTYFLGSSLSCLKIMFSAYYISSLCDDGHLGCDSM